MSNTFNKDNIFGAYGERICKEWLEDNWHHVEDVSHVEEYQIKDIDFVVDGERTVEIKTDKEIYRTGNMFVEIKSITKNGYIHDGWLKKTEAKYIFYLDWKNLVLYVVNTKALRRTIKNLNLSEHSTTNYYDKKTTWFYLMPIQKLLAHTKTKVIDLSEYQYIKDEYENEPCNK